MRIRSFLRPTRKTTSEEIFILMKHTTTRKFCHSKCAGCTMGKDQTHNSVTSAPCSTEKVLRQDTLKQLWSLFSLISLTLASREGFRPQEGKKLTHFNM